MVKKKDKQAELPGMPEQSEAGKTAKEYLDARVEFLNAKDIMEGAAVELVRLMKKSKQSKISIEEGTINFSHSEKDNLKVTKAKATN